MSEPLSGTDNQWDPTRFLSTFTSHFWLKNILTNDQEIRPNYHPLRKARRRCRRLDKYFVFRSFKEREIVNQKTLIRLQFFFPSIVFWRRRKKGGPGEVVLVVREVHRNTNIPIACLSRICKRLRLHAVHFYGTKIVDILIKRFLRQVFFSPPPPLEMAHK